MSTPDEPRGVAGQNAGEIPAPAGPVAGGPSASPDTGPCTSGASSAGRTWAYAVAVLGAFLIVAGLVWAMQRYTRPPALGAARAAERAKALAELRAAEAQAMATTAWLDQTNGIVRLRVEDAVRIVEREWGANPAAGRSNLLARVQKAFPAPPPKAPEKPSAFE